MLQLSINMHRKNPGYEVRAVIGVKQLKQNDQEMRDSLQELQSKLEKTLPGNFRAKYNINSDGLVVTVKVDQAGQAQSTLHKMEQFINSAAMALKLK